MTKIKRRIISIFTVLAFLSTTILSLSLSFAEDYPYKDCWNDGMKDDGEGGDDFTPGEGADPPYCDDKADPVNLFTGNFKYTMQDLFIPARGLPIVFKRYYNSMDIYDGPFGRGWSHSYNIRLYEVQDGAGEFVTLKNYDGTTLSFKHLTGVDYQTLSEHSFDELKKYATFPSDILAVTQTGFDGGFCLRKKHGREYLFSFSGQLRMIVDRNRNKLTLGHDASDRLSSVTDTTGRAISFVYNSNNKLSRITDFTGREFAYSYDNTGNLMSAQMPESANCPDGAKTEYAYSSSSLLTAITDPNANTYLSNSYDEASRVIEQNYGNGTFKFAYEFLKTVFTDCNGNVTEYYFNSDGTTYQKIHTGNFTGYLPTSSKKTTRYEYNAKKQVTRTIQPRGNVIDKEYDDKGNVLRIIRRPNQYSDDTYSIITVITYEPDYNMLKTFTDPMGSLTSFNYDGQGNLIQVVYPVFDSIQPVIDITYNQYGQIETVTDPNSIITRYEYFQQTGYLEKVINNYGASVDVAETNFSYDALGNVTSLTDARGNTTAFEYDEINNITRAVFSAPFNFETLFEYDNNSNIIYLKRQASNDGTQWQIVEYEYNAKDMVTSVKQYSDVTDYLQTTYVYDKNDNLAELIDPQGSRTNYVYDSSDLLVQVIDAADNLTAYTYDANTNLFSITDAKGNVTVYEYDLFERLIRIIYPDVRSEGFSYNKNSNIINKRLRSSSDIDYEYDALNRLIKKIYPDSSEASFVYDAASRLISATSRMSQVTICNHDNLNRLVQITDHRPQGTDKIINYEYDNLGNRTKLTYPDNSYVTYEYDELNRLTAVKDMANGNIAAYLYDALSRRSTLTYVNSKQSTYQYDNINRLTQLTNSPIIQPSDFNYTYDKAGNRISMTVNTTDVHSYTYDNIYQISAVDYPDTYTSADANYTYDKLGNRQAMVSGTTTHYTVNGLNQYTFVGGLSISYDYNGNMTDDWTNAYEYDYENRLTKATTANNIVEYEYDAFGRRIGKNIFDTNHYPLNAIRYIYDGDQVILEYDENDQLLRKYVYGIGIDEPIKLTDTSSGASYYYHFDGLGSVIALTDASGAVVESYEYDVYGNVVILDQTLNPIPQSQIGNAYLFTGRRFDAETGLYYYRARHYSPVFGRFLQTDPVGYYDSMNLYQYCLNNPVNWVDPWGLFIKNILNFMEGLKNAQFKIDLASAIRKRQREIGNKLGKCDTTDQERLNLYEDQMKLDELFNKISKAGLQDILDMVSNAGSVPGTFSGGTIPTSINEAIADEIIDNFMEKRGKRR